MADQQGLLDEIDDLKEEVDNLKQELATTKDDYDKQLDDMKAQLDKIKVKTEDEWKKKLKEADREARERLALMGLELDMMRQAFSGDTGGWTKVETATQEYYQNAETGEVRQDEPEVLFVARQMKKCQEAEELIVETTQLRRTKEENEAKIKELSLQVNKTKTELNSLRAMDKSWKEATKTVHAAMMGYKSMMDAQTDQILGGLSAVSRASKRAHYTVPLIDQATGKYVEMRDRVAKQESIIMKANARIRDLEAELADNKAKVAKLSAGIDEEVERLAKPMRDRMADSMLQVMKEKAARAQERRELADLWPSSQMLPTLLLQYRTLDAGERKRRVERYHAINANAALVLEIRANMAEKTKWTEEFDDYGRPFFQHKETKQTSEERPAILDYVPPAGRDEMGNVQQNPQELGLWKMMTDNRGKVYFRHAKTGEVSDVSPFAYPKVPFGRSEEEIAAESALLVLGFIKKRIARHIEKQAKLKQRLENPVSAEEKAEYLAKNGVPFPEEDLEESEGDGPSEDLSAYMYDIETVEMIAQKFGKAAPASKDDDKLGDEQKRDLNMAFMADPDKARRFDKELYTETGPTLLETDTTELGIPELRKIVEKLATKEERLENFTGKVRANLRDFSYVLMEKIHALDREKQAALDEENEAKLAEKKEQVRAERIAAKKEARRKRREQEAEAAANLSKIQGLLGGEAEGVSPDAVDQTQAPSGEQKDGVEMQADEKSVVSATKSVGDKSVKSAGDKSATSKGSKGSKPDAPKDAPSAVADDKSVRSKDKSEAGESKQGGPGDSVSQAKTEKSSIAGGSGGGEDEEKDEDDEEEEEAADAKSETSEVTVDDVMLEEAGDPDVLLYGEVSLDFSNPQFNEEIMRTSLNLVNFTVFCGYANIRIDEAPDDANMELSILPEQGEDKVPEDQWLTHSFFLGMGKDRVDAVREVTSLQYDPLLGLLNTIPLATARLVAEASPVEGERGDKSYTQAVENVRENLRATHALWRSQQLMMEVLRFQFQQAAVREAFYNRFQDLVDEKVDRRNSRQSLIPMTAALHARKRPVELTIKRVYAVDISTKVWADQQPQFIQLSVGPWGARTPPLTALGRPLLWENLDIRALMPLDRIQLDDMLIEAFDEHSLRHNVLLCSARLPINSMLGPKLGSDVEIEFKMLNTKRQPTGAIVRVLMKCDYSKDPAPFVADPDNLQNTQLNLVESPVPDVFIPMMDGASQEAIGANARGYVVEQGPGLLVKQDSIKSVVSNLSLGGAEDTPAAAAAAAAVSADGGDAPQNASIEDGGGHSVLTGTHSQTASQRNEDDALSGLYPTSLRQQQASFEELVADLRGDGVNFMKRLVGDVVITDVLNAGHRINEQIIKPLPNFKKATAYLQKKAAIHSKECELLRARVTESQLRLDTVLKEKIKSVTETYERAQREYLRTIDVSADIKAKVKAIVASLDDLRKPPQRPIEPTFPPLPDLPYVPKIPEKGALDEKGKKKKQIPNVDMKAIITNIEDAKSDAVEWDFGKYWPSQAQQLKINKAITERNEVLDNQRLEDNQARMKIMERYQNEIERWENDEKARKVEFEKTKKESRKANLRLDFYLQRTDRRGVMAKNLQRDLETLLDLDTMHKKAKDRTKVMGMKQYFEAERQRETMLKLRKRLLKALDARQRALDLPRGAINKIQFEELRGRAEEALRTLRVEVVECKQLLLAEGVRLRTMRSDELSMLKNEQARADMTLEMIRQKDDIDKVVDKYQYEVVHLMEAMEKLVIIEADKDDRGLKDTVDNLGERYGPTKKWESKEIDSCRALMDLVMEKIHLTESFATTSTNSMKLLAEALITKWGTDFVPVRDSWCENSDYDRSQKLVHDVVQWVAIQRNKLGDSQKMAELEAIELRLQVQAGDQQKELMLKNQESDTKYVTEAALNIVNVMQHHIDGMRETSRKREEDLDKQITDAVREAQSVREQLMFQAQANDSKQKLLWAMINTLQTATQSLSNRMDIIIHERDRLVYKCRIDNDKMKSQLRLERKHAANLLFIIHSQRGTNKYLRQVIKHYEKQLKIVSQGAQRERAIFRKEIWEQIFCFTRLSTDADALFEFFAARLANLAGARKTINEQLADNGAALVLAALCKSPRPLVRKYASRAIAGLGWDGYVETRVLLWDCVTHWRIFKAGVLEREQKAYQAGYESFAESGKFDALLNLEGTVEEFVPSGNMSLRTIIKQRRQWALRATRRVEGPNSRTQRLINMKDGVINALMELCMRDGDVDWEIVRNAALAISIASFEPQNHYDMTNDQGCVQLLIKMCSSDDAEVQTHAAVTIANLCHKDENAQAVFGNSQAVPAAIFMCKSIVVDVLEAATAALANLTCFCDANCHKVMEGGGVKEMVRLITQAYSQNLLDLDQNDEVQANAAEMLANVSRVNGEFTGQYFDRGVIDAVILMCAATNKQVKRHAPLVLGNVSQSEHCREIIGDRGGVEALFLVLEDNDLTIKANTLWALCNLMWWPPNQERAGRFLSEIIAYLTHDYLPIRTHASILLANALYYNNPNRVRFLESEGAMELIVSFIVERVEPTIVESSLRCVLSLSYLDNIALWLGTDGACVPVFLSLMIPAYVTRDCMRYALEISSNLCVHHSNRLAILDAGGIGVIVALQQDSDPHIQDLANQIIAYLEDVTPAEVLAKAKMDIGLERMVVLATNSDPVVRAVAAESIGEEVWRNPKMQRRALEVGGVDVLLALINTPTEPTASLLPALWSLRNLLHDSPEAQAQLAFRDGLVSLTQALGRAVVGQFGDQTEKVLEATLACMASAIASHERNARRLLVVGLEALMDIAEGKMPDVVGAGSRARGGMAGEGVLALAKSILLLLGPYNYVVCGNCNKKQDLNGESCFSCGHRLRVAPIDPAERNIMREAQAEAKAARSKLALPAPLDDPREPGFSATAPASLGGSMGAAAPPKPLASKTLGALKGLPKPHVPGAAKTANDWGNAPET